MEIDNGSFDHLQDCANGLRDLVADGKVDTALKVATYLLKEGQLAILNMKRGKVKDFYPKVTALLEALENSNIDSHPKLRHTVAKTLRVFAQLAVDRMGEPFPEDVKSGLLTRIKPRLKASKVGSQFALRYELTCLQEAVKVIDTGISLFNLSLAAGVVKGGVELAKGEGAGSLLSIAGTTFSELHAMWYFDALRLSWVGVMAKNDPPTFEFFIEEVNKYVDQCKFVDLKKRHVLIGLVDTFAEITWTSAIEQYQKTAAVWIANLADPNRPKALSEEVRYRAVEQLIAMKRHHVDIIRDLAKAQLKLCRLAEEKEVVQKLLKTTAGRQNTGFRERPELVPPRSVIKELLKDPLEGKIENLHSDVLVEGAKLNEQLKILIQRLGFDSPPFQERTIQRVSQPIPVPSCPGYVEREEIAPQMRAHLCGPWVRFQSAKVLLLAGFSGMGKTVLAAQFVEKEREQFSLIGWIKAEDIEGSYLKIAQQWRLYRDGDRPEDSVEIVHKALAKWDAPQPALLVFDNLESRVAIPNKNVVVLITTRDEQLYPNHPVVRVDRLEPEEAKLLVKKLCPLENNDEQLERLAETFSNDPLSLAAAANYIGQSPIETIERYLKNGARRTSPVGDYPLTRKETFVAALERLGSEAPVAHAWLGICSALSPDSVPLAALECWLDLTVCPEEPDVIVTALNRSSLLHYDKATGTFQIHRSVQEAICTHKWIRAAFDFLVKSGNKPFNGWLENLALPHFSSYLSNSFQANFLAGVEAEHLADYEEALDWLDKAKRVSAASSAERKRAQEKIDQVLKMSQELCPSEVNGSWPKLHQAAFFGRLDLIEMPANLDVQDENGTTALHWAAQRGHLSTVEELLELGADINVKDKQNLTPLVYSCAWHQTAVLKALLDAGADCSEEWLLALVILDHFQTTWPPKDGCFDFFADIGIDDRIEPLCKAGCQLKLSISKKGVIGPHLRVVKWLEAFKQERLIEHIADHKGFGVADDEPTATSPLLLCAHTGLELCCKALIDRGGDINARDRKGETPIFRAIRGEQIDFVPKMIEWGADVKITNLQGASVLHRAIFLENDNLIATLAQAGANPNATCGEREATPLDLAAHEGKAGSISALVKAGGRLEKKNADERTPLLEAIVKGHLLTVQQLVEEGASLTAREGMNKTVLHAAVEFNRLEILKFLIEKGGNMDTVDEGGWTPLRYCIHLGNMNCFNALVAAGVQVVHGPSTSILNRIGNDPLCIAISAKRISFALALIHAGACEGVTDVAGLLKYVEQEITSPTDCLKIQSAIKSATNYSEWCSIS